MPIEQANNAVSLGRNIVALIAEIKSIISTEYRKNIKYTIYMKQQILIQNNIFNKLSEEYYNLISTMRTATQKAESSEELYARYTSFMQDRDRISVPRSELRGSIDGIQRLIEYEAPIIVSESYMKEYREYIEAMDRFFYGSIEIENSSLFRNIFEKAMYVFDWSNENKENQVDYRDNNKLTSQKKDVIGIIDEARSCMEHARRDAAEKYSYLEGRLASKI